MNIMDALKMAAKGLSEVYSLVGEVTEIDESGRTCTVQPVDDQEALIYGVRLQAEIDGSVGAVVFPKKGSMAIVTFLNESTGYLALCSEVEAIEWTVGEKTLTFDSSGLRVVSEASDLKTELNALADLIDSLLTTLQTFQLATNVGPTVSVMPNHVADLVQYQLSLAQVKQNLNTIIH